MLVAACAHLARADGTAPAPLATVTLAPSGGGAPRTLSLADLAARQDVHDAQYTLRTADGSTSIVAVAAGISLATLVSAASLDGDAFTYVEVARADGTTVLVVRERLAGTDEGPPVVWSDEQGVHFLRPSEGDDDPNAGDLVTSASGTLDLTLRTGDPLAVRISASALRARPREPIDFSASLAAGALGPGMRFQWYFDDSRYAYGASVTHRFKRAGAYNVLLNVMRGGEAIGSPAVVLVRVARPPQERRSDGARRAGERRGGGDGSGASGGTGGGSGAGGAGAGAGGGGTGATGGGTTPAPVATPPPPAAAAPPPLPRPAPRRASPPPAQPQGELVSGTLLASVSEPAADADGPRAAVAAHADEAREGPLDVPVGAWVAIGLVALVALGWTLESRHTLPFWQP